MIIDAFPRLRNRAAYSSMDCLTGDCNWPMTAIGYTLDNPSPGVGQQRCSQQTPLLPMQKTKLVPLYILLFAAIACSGERPRTAAPEEPPDTPVPVYRCEPDRLWRPAPLGQELRCSEHGELVCPRGNCRVAYRPREMGRWEPDIDWRKIGGRRQPVQLWRQNVYRVSIVPVSLELRSEGQR